MRSQPPPDGFIEIEGRLAQILYYNPENHYFIGKLQKDHTRQSITVVGYMPQPGPGEILKIQGAWQTHPKYGQQLRIHTFEVLLPSTVEGIRHFLASGLIKGIGDKTAARIVDRFQQQSLHIIESEPDRLLEIDGIGIETVRRISDAWQAYQGARDVIRFLQAHEIPSIYGAKLFSCYGQEAMALLQSDPLQIIRDLPRIGFLIVDKLMQDAGVAPDDPDRIAACLLHLIHQSVDDGNCFMREQELLNLSGARFNIPTEAVRRVIDFLEECGDVVADPIDGNLSNRAVYLRHLYTAEVEVAHKIAALTRHPPASVGIESVRIERIILQCLAIQLSQEQSLVLKQVLNQRVAVITGGPGTGKTTLIRSITAIFSELGRHFVLAAPTGRAARRLSTVTHQPAATIHKLLGFNAAHGGFEKNRDNPLEADVVIVDEASMVDVLLMAHLISAVHLSAQLILVGDAFQLPSVGPGSVLSDLIANGHIPTFELTEIFRQAGQSPIVVNAHKVRRGESMDGFWHESSFIDATEFKFLPHQRLNSVVDSVVDLCGRQIPQQFGFDPLHDIQVLVPMHKGLVGTMNLNQVLQNALNPDHPAVPVQGQSFKTGDKVMHLRNNYQKEVYNGDIGFIVEVDVRSKVLTVDFEGRSVDYEFSETDELCLAYAISIHKSQGSEYPAVVIPIVMQHSVMLYRSLLYTAITRGKSLVVLVGSPKALAAAVSNDRPQRRQSALTARLAALVS